MISVASISNPVGLCLDLGPETGNCHYSGLIRTFCIARLLHAAWWGLTALAEGKVLHRLDRALAWQLVSTLP